ncbi:MAG TPA: Fic family protein [Candidatus Dojkabacteria bacterium]|nr:Fic family protein [Candidatus Dojkabacteria bacterium]
MAYSPQFSISNKILNNVAQAEAAKQIIENSPLVPYWERKFQSQALIRTIHHSTAIEGNKLDLLETQKIVAGEQVETVRLRDVQEIINYRNVIEFLSSYQGKTLDLEFIFSVHKRLGEKILHPKYLGVFRERNAVVVNSFSGEVIFDAPDHDELELEVGEIVDWDRVAAENSAGSKSGEAGDLHPLIKAGILHFEFVRIHPFVDLNGRTARIIATWSMYRDGYDINRLFSLEEHYDQDLQRYYDALDSAHESDLTNWLEYFTDGVSEELHRVKEQVLVLSMDRRLRTKLGQVALNERQIDIINYIEEYREFKNPDFGKLFPKISDDTILRDLKDLMEKGLIVKKGRTKASNYQLTVH